MIHRIARLAALSCVLAWPLTAGAQIEIPEYGDFGDPYDNFGAAVVVDGDRAVFAPARGRQGADPDLFVYLREAGQWRREADLETGWESGEIIAIAAAPPQVSVRSNWKIVALQDPWLVVGMPQRSHLGEARAGAVRIYRRGAGGWAEHALLQAPTNQGQGRFGGSVALSGDRLAVGQPGASRVEIYRLQGEVWEPEATLPAPVPESGFGAELAFSGEQLVVRSSAGLHMYKHDDAQWSVVHEISTSDAGFSTTNPWTLDGDLLATATFTGMRFFRRSGSAWALDSALSSLSVSADSGISGTLRGFAVRDGSPVRLAGYGFGPAGQAAMLSRYWEFSDGAWSSPREIALPAADVPSAYRFSTSFSGVAFAFTDQRLLAGARLVSLGRVVSQGAGYVYSLGTQGPALERSFRHGNGWLGDNFGHWIAIDGEWALVAARGADQAIPGGLVRDAGKVLVYRRSGANWSAVQTLELDMPEAFNALGERVALKGRLALVAGQGSEAGIASHGQLHVFRRDDQDQWNALCRLTPPVTPDGLPQAFRNRGDGQEDSTPFELMSTDGEHIAAVYMGRVYAWLADAEGCSLVGEVVIPDRVAVPGGVDVLQPSALGFEVFGRSMLEGRLVVNEGAGFVGQSSTPSRTHVFDFVGGEWTRSFVYTASASDSCAQTFGGAFVARDHLRLLCRRCPGGVCSSERVDWVESAPGEWSSSALPVPELLAGESAWALAGETLITVQSTAEASGTSLLLRVREPPAYAVAQELGPTDACVTYITSQIVFFSANDLFVPCSYAIGANGRGAGALQIFSRGAASPFPSKGLPLFGSEPQVEQPPPRPDVVRDGFEAVP